MRMRKLAFLLVPILLLAIVSCDGDIFGTLSDFMGQTGTNVYVEGGLVTIDTSQGAAIVASIGNLSDATTDEEYAAEVETVKAAITEALTSPQKTEALKLAMSETLTIPDGGTIVDVVPQRAQDIVDAINLNTELGITIDLGDVTTEGDLVALILVTELYNKVADVNFDTLTEGEALELVSEALQIVEIVNKISPTGAISLDDILSNLIDDPDLLNQIMGRSSSTSRSTSRAEGDEDDPMTFIEPIFNTVINAIGKDGSGNIDSAKLAQAVNSFKMIRLSYEQMAPALVGSGAELELTDVINYVLSVVFTEADAFFQTVPGSITFEDALNDVIYWMNQDATYQDTYKPAFVDAIADWEVEFDEYRAMYPVKFGDETTTPRTVGSIERTLDALIGALPGDNTLITDALEDLFAGSEE
ncbi:MAG: hypothetical protein VB025_01905 [Sphaerochaeta sp.]|nr:hypothetical protein [Sphaerochaeta sp.]